MSMELLVLLALEQAPDVHTWNQALSDQGTSLQISESVNLASHTGFLPMTLGGKETGLYFSRGSFSELAESYPGIGEPPHANAIVYTLSYGGDFSEALVAFLSASALVAKFNGIAFEPQEGQFMSERELRDAARQLEQLGNQ